MSYLIYCDETEDAEIYKMATSVAIFDIVVQATRTIRYVRFKISGLWFKLNSFGSLIGSLSYDKITDWSEISLLEKQRRKSLGKILKDRIRESING